MVHLILQKEYCLSDPTLHAVESMAFDGSHYLFCDGKSPSVFEINRSSMVRTIRTPQVYKSLCYDTASGCFWALPAATGAYVDRLNQQFVVEGQIPTSKARGLPLDAIGFDAANDRLLLFGPQGAWSLDKRGKELKSLWQNPQQALLCCGCFAQQYHFSGLYCFDSKLSPIRILDAKNQPVNMACLPETFLLRSMCCAYDRDGGLHLFVLALKDYTAPHMLEYQLLDIVE